MSFHINLAARTASRLPGNADAAWRLKNATFMTVATHRATDSCGGPMGMRGILDCVDSQRRPTTCVTVFGRLVHLPPMGAVSAGSWVTPKALCSRVLGTPSSVPPWSASRRGCRGRIVHIRIRTGPFRLIPIHSAACDSVCRPHRKTRQAISSCAADSAK